MSPRKKSKAGLQVHALPNKSKQAGKVRRPRTLPPKLTTPRPANLYARKRLFALLDGIRKAHRVLWISAPGGAGKTSLVASYLQARKAPVLWYQVDSGDGDLASFFYYMTLAVQHAAPRYKQPLPLLTPEYHGDIPTFTRNFVREACRRLPMGMVLVLDNYQDVPEDAALHNVLPIVMEEVPAHLTLLVLSRLEPPSVLARLRLCEHAACLDWDKLQLTREETEGISVLRLGNKKFDAATLDQLHERAAGWTAGVVLMLERAKGPSLHTVEVMQPTSVMFDYFARECLERADDAEKRFLLSTALFSSFTLSMARNLLRDVDARRILDDLCRRNFFIHRSAGAQENYEYHQLFRGFLLDRANDYFTPTALTSLRNQAAQILSERGELDAAVRLWQANRDWGRIEALLKKNVARLLAQGRGGVLVQWFDAMPAEVMQASPWLCYWYGTSILPVNISRSRNAYMESYRNFWNSHDDPAGSFLSWSGVVDTYVYERGDFSPLDDWIAEFDRLLDRYPKFPSPQVRARAIFAIFCALMYRQPQHPRIGEWRDAVAGVVEGATDFATQIMLGAHLIFYDIWWTGNLSRATNLRNRLQSMIDKGAVPPLIRITWHSIEAAYYWVVGQNEAGRQSVEQGLALAESSGIHLWDVMMLGQGVWSTITAGQLSEARAFLARMQECMVPTRRLDFSHFHYQSYIVAWHESNTAAMRFHAQEAVRLSREAGVLMLEGYARVGLAWTLRELGEHDEANKQHAAAQRIAEQMGSEATRYCCALPALIFLKGKNVGAVDFAKWKEAVEIAARQGFVNHPWWQEETMARLYVWALDANVETGFVKRTITLRQLHPPLEGAAPFSWPFPLKLYTLGRFSMVKDDKPIRFAAKAQKKTLELLKALIAFGGREVSEGKLAEVLWPDTEGDDAKGSLRTTLHRLRKLIGEEMIVYSEGKLTLDPRHCWVDVWALERKLTQLLDTASARIGVSDFATVLSLYHGPFLGDEEAGYALSMRERLRSKYLRTIEHLAQGLFEQQQFDVARTCYERAIEIEPLAERFYRGLMQCQQSLGQAAGVLRTYAQCCAVLKRELGVEPCAETRALSDKVRATATDMTADRRP